MLNLRKGFSVTFADKLIEGYKSDGKSITANVSAEKTLPLLEQFIKLHEDEKLFFVLELPTPETAEPKDENGLLYAGNDGTTDESYEINGDFEQEKLPVYTFKNTNPDIDWCYLRKYHPDNYELSSEKYVLKGTDITLDDVDSPTFIKRHKLVSIYDKVFTRHHILTLINTKNSILAIKAKHLINVAP